MFVSTSKNKKSAEFRSFFFRKIVANCCHCNNQRAFSKQYLRYAGKSSAWVVKLLFFNQLFLDDKMFDKFTAAQIDSYNTEQWL